MSFSNLNSACKGLRNGTFSLRNYGTTIATKKNPAKQPALMLRGKIPAEKTDNRLILGAIVSLGCWGYLRWLKEKQKEENKRLNYLQMVESNMGPWRDFDNRRMPAYAKLIGNETPCGDAFKEAYMCSIFGQEGESCSEQFGAFMGCLEENPVMLRDVKPDGSFNWASKLFLHNLMYEKKIYDDLIASVGPADEDMDDVYNSYKAREILGANATEQEITAFKDKFNGVRSEFYAEVEALFDGSKTDHGKADALLKQIIANYSVPQAVWLQVMKDYDIEEFDEAVTLARRKFGTVLKYIHVSKNMKKVRDADLSEVTCGDQFDKMYACMDHKKDQNDCLDVIDELYFCRLHHFNEVFPRPTHPEIGPKVEGVQIFQTPDPSFKAEIQRPQVICGFPGIVY